MSADVIPECLDADAAGNLLAEVGVNDGAADPLLIVDPVIRGEPGKWKVCILVG